MSGGGGGYQAPQDNSIQLEQMRQAAADRAQAAADAKAAQEKTDFQHSLSKAVRGAHSTGVNYFGSRGLSGDDYSSLIDSIIRDAKLKVPNLDVNPASYFTTDTFASGLDTAQTNERAGLNSKVNALFTPGFDKSLISDTADDSIIDSILGKQRDSALQQIDFNRKRGVLNDTGYSSAMDELAGQENAGRSTLTGIGDAILGKDRQHLLDIYGDAGKAASNFTYGMAKPDASSYYKTASDKALSDIGGLEGAIRSSLGSTNLFDVPSLLQKGGTAQGPINLTTADASSSLPFDPKKSSTKRGLGSTGVF